MSYYRRYFTQNGDIVFITMVTYNRQPILIDNIDLVRESFKSIKYKFEIIAGIVLKDHIHILVRPENIEELPKIITFFKYHFSRNYPNITIKSEIQQKRQEKGIWQRRYYDHIIRDANDLYKHIDYIHYNSVKHYNIAPKDWEFSSFKKFVADKWYEENWYNFGDKYNIENMEYE